MMHALTGVNALHIITTPNFHKGSQSIHQFRVDTTIEHVKVFWSASSVMMHALTGVNALLKTFYTTKEIIENCPKINRLE
jgi:hypothetical protein